jgi:hypothetical protein
MAFILGTLGVVPIWASKGDAMEGVEGQVVGRQSIIHVLLGREVRAMEVLKHKVSPAYANRMRFKVTQQGPTGNKGSVRGRRARTVHRWVLLLLRGR